jgi:glutamine cyclotransferase
MRFYFLISIISLTMACNPATNVKTNTNISSNAPANAATKTSGKVPTYTYEIANTYPHDPKAFTQGLVFYNGFFYEGTGGRQRDSFHSSLRKTEVESGKVLQKFDLAGEFFGEGITIFNGKIYQITWEEQTAFVYDLNDFKLLKQFHYTGEGWGLTHDDKNLIMSDGTHVIRFINPENFETVRTIAVLDEQGKPVMELNELEFVKGEIWSNVWQKGVIIRIDPTNGKLLGKIDLNKLADQQMNSSRDADVLNGIAYDEANDRIFITGKKWDKVFEIKLKPKD